MIFLNEAFMLDILVTSFGVEHNFKCFVHSLLCQDDSNWRCRIMSDGEDPCYEVNKKWLDETVNDSRITYEQSEVRFNDWGHSLRDKMIKELPSDSSYAILQNSDNYLMPNYVKHFNSVNKQEPYMTICNFMNNKETVFDHMGVLNRYYDVSLKHACIDMGCICVKSDVAKSVGFNHRLFESDWKYIQDLVEYLVTNDIKGKILKIKLGLFVHN